MANKSIATVATMGIDIGKNSFHIVGLDQRGPPDQLDLQALHRVRERLVRQRAGIINQIRTFLLERGIAVRQGLRFLRTELPVVLAKRADALSPRMMRIIEDLASDWRRLDERIEGLSADITSLVEKHPACERGR